jgi:hypothetical protein
LYIYDACKSARSKITDPIALVNLAAACGANSATVEVTVRRLCKDGFLQKVESKFGKGGWTIYGLPDALHQELLVLENADKLRTKSEQTSNKVRTKVRTKLRTSSPSSSSKLDYLNTTTAEPHTLFEEWKQIDCTSLQDIHFGATQLSQIAQLGKLSPVEVQDSIDAFAFDLRKNQKGKTLKGSPLNFFMGILRKGMLYAPPENYESPQDEARRKYLEHKRALALQRDMEEQELFELEFQEWYRALSLEQRREIAPHAKIDGSEMQLGSIKEYFRGQIYKKQFGSER